MGKMLLEFLHVFRIVLKMYMYCVQEYMLIYFIIDNIFLFDL